MSNNKVKGLLKGLRYISQIFENEKEAEMQIGYPTDVKHVAHIGWDGPSVNSPSWMNEFKTSPSFSSAPLTLLPAPRPRDIKDHVSVKWVSEDSNRRGGGGGGGGGGRLKAAASNSATKSSTPQSSSGNALLDSSQSPTTTREKIDKPKPRRSSKPKDYSSSDHSPFTLPDIPRNSRRKKTSAEASTCRNKTHVAVAVAVAETYTSPFSDPGSSSGSMSISTSKDTGLCHTP